MIQDFLNSTKCEDVPRIFNTTELGIIHKFKEETKFAEMVTYIVNGCLLVTSIAVTSYYMKFRINEFDRLKARSLPLIVSGHLGALIQLHTGSFAKFMDSQVPCNLLVLASVMVVPLIVIPFSVKLIQLKKQDFLTNVAAQGIELDEERASVNSAEQDRGGNGSSPRVKRDPCLKRMLNVASRDLSILLGQDKRSGRFSRKKSQTSVADSSPKLQDIATPLQKPILPPSRREIMLWRFSAGAWGAVITLVFLNVPFVIVALTSFAAVPPIYFTSCLGCHLGRVHMFFIIGEGIVAIIMVATLYWSLRKHRDPFGVLQEIRLCIIWGAVPSLIAFILNFLDFTISGGFSFNIFVSIFLVIMSLIQGWLQVLLAERDAVEIRMLHMQGVDLEEEGEEGGDEGNDQNNNNKGGEDGGGNVNEQDTAANGKENDQHQQQQQHSPRPLSADYSVMHRPASSRASWTNQNSGVNFSVLLNVVLSDPVLRNAFHAHLCEEHNVEPLSFLDAVDRWKRHFPHSPKETSSARAKRIIKNFIGPKAPFPLPISSAQVDQLIRRTARPDALTIDTFEGVRADVARILEFGPLVRFVKSHIWKGFVEDGLILSPDNYRAGPLRLVSRHSSMNSPAAADGHSRQTSSLRLRTTTNPDINGGGGGGTPNPVFVRSSSSKLA